ncbi:MAG TPA: peptidylprolyl isomerase [Bdellovibrionales bacterium]|nr:peptidylprolyl isomerase [Bdellovibrionales bacterium]
MRVFPKIAAVLVGLAMISQIAFADTVERIVAVVNDEIITQSDLEKYSDRLKGGGLTDDLLIPDEATKQSLIKDKEKLLQKMIDEKVIDSEVKKQSMTVPIERVEQEIRTIARKNGVGRDDLKAALSERGVKFSDYQDFIKTGLERQGLIEKAITSRIKVSEDDVMMAFANRGGGSGDQAYEYTLSHIVFLSEKGGAPAAKQRAEEALKKLKAGQAFDRLAADVSEDPAFEQGGLLGTFKTGEINKGLEQSIVKVPAGETTSVIPMSGGYQIVKVLKKKLIPDPRTEKEREKIRGELYEKAFKRQLALWLEQLRHDAFIRINK